MIRSFDRPEAVLLPELAQFPQGRRWQVLANLQVQP